MDALVRFRLRLYGVMRYPANDSTEDTNEEDEERRDGDPILPLDIEPLPEADETVNHVTRRARESAGGVEPTTDEKSQGSKGDQSQEPESKGNVDPME